MITKKILLWVRIHYGCTLALLFTIHIKSFCKIVFLLHGMPDNLFTNKNPIRSKSRRFYIRSYIRLTTSKPEFSGSRHRIRKQRQVYRNAIGKFPESDQQYHSLKRLHTQHKFRQSKLGDFRKQYLTLLTYKYQHLIFGKIFPLNVLDPWTRIQKYYKLIWF